MNTQGVSLCAANRALVRRKPTICRNKSSLWLFSIQVLLFILLFRFDAIWFKKKQKLLTFPVFKHSEHFQNSIGPYTSLVLSSREMASKNFLNSTDLDAKDTIVLQHFVTNYVAFHKANKRKGCRRFIFSQSGGGLGDRFQGMFFAYWVAVATERVFLVEWDLPFPLQDFLTEAEEGLELFYNQEKERPPMIRHQNGSMVPDILYITPAMTSQQQFERVLESKTHTVKMKTSRYLTQFSRRFIEAHRPKGLSATDMRHATSNTNLKRALLHHVFCLKGSVRKRYEKLSEELGLKGQDSVGRGKGRIPYIAVHARLGRGVGESANRFGPVIEQMNTAAKCLASRAIRLSYMSGSPPLPVFLATDTYEFRNIFTEILLEMSDNRVRAVSGSWKAVHTKDVVLSLEKLLDRNQKSPINNTVELAKKSMWESYADLLMLGHAEHIIALYSSFPRLAFTLGDAESLTEIRNDICLEKEQWHSQHA